ncbi:MAG: ATP-binding cassette domain-containing protein [Myxococcota bacterium]|nr:ATP-binding cassette domain-containing protein [Myxococcota bacterium]
MNTVEMSLEASRIEPAAPAIAVAGVTKRYGQIRAVDGISFTIQPGEVVGFLGPNGAGKTTTMRMIAHHLCPTSGDIRILGQSSQHAHRDSRQRLGYLPENAPAYPEMTVGAFLTWTARIKRINKHDRSTRLSAVIETCGLDAVVDRRIGHLSRGYRQRVGLAQAIIHKPEVLLLDEPLSGLDPNQIEEFKNVIRRYGRSKTVVFSSHRLPDVEALCDRVIIFYEGRIVADRKLTEPNWSPENATFVIVVGGNSLTRIAPFISSRAFVTDCQVIARAAAGWTFKVTTTDEEQLRTSLVAAIIAQGWSVHEFSRQTDGLASMFRQVTQAR